MKFHKEGRASIIIASLLSLAILFLGYKVLDFIPFAKPVAVLLVAFVMLAVLQFFRNPTRHMVSMDEAVISPADGKVVVIEEVEDIEYFKKKVRQISVFMSPTNVHINWYPVAGEVVYSKYHKGKYLVAWDPKSSVENERHSIVIKHPVHGEILVKQIAGAVARRIVNYAKVGETIQQGDEMGFIKFGSRVDLLIPLDANVKVELEEVSTGGQSIIATFS